MPEFIPPPQLPTGMAERLIELKSQSGNPWAALAQNLGNTVGNTAQNIGQSIGQRRESMATPAEMQAMNLRQPAQGPTRPGQAPLTQQATQPMRLSLAEKLTQQQTANTEKENLLRMQGKGSGVPANHFVVTQKDLDGNPDWVKKGIALNDTLPDAMRTNSTKPPAANKAVADQGNMKLVTDYASKNGVSLDALRPGGMGGWNSNNLAMVAQMIKDHPDYDAANLKKEFAGQLAASTRGAGTTAATGAAMKVNLESAHSGFTAVMDMAKDVAAKMDKGQIGIFNSAIQRGETEFNDENSIAMNTYLDMAAGNYARITKGGMASISDEDKEDAKKILSKKLNAGGLEAVQKAMDVEYKGRIAGLPGGKKEAKAEKSPSGKPAAEHDGKSTEHTYPDGTKAKWDGKQWVKV